ncbi:uncharacterized protein METZ01_LOCUS168948 [marine metagenome]|uniref:Uncharacterized protein n=1 Tax=marine metagenome TaxID=408172 RepID=A0A382BR04_9ZZZZ
MLQRKIKTKLILKKFLKENKNILKELTRKTIKAKPYTRDPWMMNSKVTEDTYEEFLKKETEDF